MVVSVHAPRIWLVRHGETDWNAAGRIQGHRDEPRLTARGWDQVAAVADQLTARPVVAVYASDLARTRQSADVISRRTDVAVEYDARLRERCFGSAEGGPVGTLPDGMTGVADDRVVDGSARPPGGESLTDVLRRCRSFVDDLDPAPPTGDVVLVVHGGSLRMLRAVLTATPLSGLAWDAVPNTWIEDHPVPDRSAPDGADPTVRPSRRPPQAVDPRKEPVHAQHLAAPPGS